MKLEILLQFIVPLTFLAIWALTSLLNRDAQPLPPRPNRGLGPGDSGPGLSSVRRSDLTGPPRYQGAGRLPSSAAERPSTATRAPSSSPHRSSATGTKYPAPAEVPASRTSTCRAERDPISSTRTRS